MGTTESTMRGTPGGGPTTPGGHVRRQPRESSITLTGRGGLAVIFGTTLLGSLLGSESLLDIGLLPGLSFVIGCVLAALRTRPADLLTVAVSPPALFFAVAIITSVVDAFGGGGARSQSVFVGLLTMLASSAPWLFLGTILVIAIMIPRGLLTDLRDLRTRLTGGYRSEDGYDDDPVRWDEPDPA